MEENQLEIKNKPILDKGGTQNQNCRTNTENTSYQKHIQSYDSEKWS